jgi:hypothetical protein
LAFDKNFARYNKTVRAIWEALTETMSEIISSNCNQRLDLGASLESFPYRNQSLVWDLATALRLKNSFNDKRHAAYKTYLQNSQSITRGQSKPLDVFVEELTLGLKIGQMRAFVKDSDAGKPDLSGLGESLAAIQQDNQQSYSVDRGLGAVALLEQRWQNAADLFRCASSRLYCDSDLRLDATFALRGGSCHEANILYGFLAKYKPFVWGKDVVAFARQHSLLSKGTLDLLELLC